MSDVSAVSRNRAPASANAKPSEKSRSSRPGYKLVADDSPRPVAAVASATEKAGKDVAGAGTEHHRPKPTNEAKRVKRDAGASEASVPSVESKRSEVSNGVVQAPPAGGNLVYKNFVDQRTKDANDTRQLLKELPNNTSEVQNFLSKWRSDTPVNNRVKPFNPEYPPDRYYPFKGVTAGNPADLNDISHYVVEYERWELIGNEYEAIHTRIPLRQAIERQTLAPKGPFSPDTGSIIYVDPRYTDSALSKEAGHVLGERRKAGEREPHVFLSGANLHKEKLIVDHWGTLQMRNDLYNADLQNRTIDTLNKSWNVVGPDFQKIIDKNIEALANANSPPVEFVPAETSDKAILRPDQRGLRANLVKRNIPESEWPKYQKTIQDVLDGKGYLQMFDIGYYESNAAVVAHSGDENEPMVTYDTLTGALMPYRNLLDMRQTMAENMRKTAKQGGSNIAILSAFSLYNQQNGAAGNKGIESFVRQIVNDEHPEYLGDPPIWNQIMWGGLTTRTDARQIKTDVYNFLGYESVGTLLARKLYEKKESDADTVFKSSSEAAWDRTSEILTPLASVLGIFAFGAIGFVPAALSSIPRIIAYGALGFGSGLAQNIGLAVGGDNFEERSRGFSGVLSSIPSFLLDYVPLGKLIPSAPKQAVRNSLGWGSPVESGQAAGLGGIAPVIPGTSIPQAAFTKMTEKGFLEGMEEIFDALVETGFNAVLPKSKDSS